jgi:hypothetical protein
VELAARDRASLYLPATPQNMAALLLAVTLLHVAAAFQIVDGVQVTAALSLQRLEGCAGRRCGSRARATGWPVSRPACCSRSGSARRSWASGIGLAFGLAVAAVLSAGGSGT